MIPRGSYALVRHVQSSTRIPVLGHSEGVCHIYVDAAANFDMALDDHRRRQDRLPRRLQCGRDGAGAPGHRAIVSAAAGRAHGRARRAPARLRAHDRAALSETSTSSPSRDDEWHTEYGDLILAVKVVPGLHEAIEHIARYGSAHTDAIVTDDAEAARTLPASKWIPPACTTTPPRASPMATATDSAPKSESAPADCTRAAPWGLTA